MTPSEHRTIAALARQQPTHKSVRPLWNASTNCMSNPVAKRSVCPISMNPTSNREMDLGYTWTAKNKIAWRMSDSVPLSDRINC